MKKALLAAVTIAAIAPLFLATGVAQAASTYTPELVKAFDTTGDTDYSVLYISSFGSKVAVQLSNGDMWISDGTTTGTTDLTSALTDAGLTEWEISRNAWNRDSVDINGELYFFGYNGTWDVWKTDGTSVTRVSTGTGVRDTMYYLGGKLYTLGAGPIFQIDPTTGDDVIVDNRDCDCGHFSGVTQMQMVNGLIVFTYDQNDCQDGLSTWDPAHPGNAPVDITAAAGALGSDASDTDYLNNTFDTWTLFNGDLYFTAHANDGSADLGNELFKTDGTQAGTVLVTDLTGGGDDGNPMSDDMVRPFIYNDELYFSGADGGNTVLWKTDGTEAGTVVAVDDVRNPGDYSENTQPVEINGKLFLDFESEAGQEFYVTDGTNAGTTMLRDINPNGDSPCEDYCQQAVLYDGHVFFIAYDDVTNAVWETDGTDAGTHQVTSFVGPDAVGNNDYSAMVVAGDTLFFGVEDLDPLLSGTATNEMALYKIGKPASLPDTGIDMIGLGGICALLVIGGLGVLALSRRKVSTK